MTSSHIEHDGRTVEPHGEILSSYEGENAPLFDGKPEARPLADMEADEILEKYSDDITEDVGDIALQATKPEIPAELRDFIDQGRQHRKSDTLEQFLTLQRARYSDPKRWN